MEQMQKTALKLTRRQEITKFLLFVLFSISAGLIQILTDSLLRNVIGLEAWWQTYLPALVASVLWNFTVNRKFTFKSVANVPVAMLKVAAYYLVFTPLSLWWGEALSALPVGISADFWHYIILIGTMLVNFGTEFLVYRFWVYGKSINSSTAGEKEQQRYTEKSGR